MLLPLYSIRLAQVLMRSLVSGKPVAQAIIGAHALAGGVVSVLQGGKFGHGFISAGLTKGLDVAGLTDFGGDGGGWIAARTAVAATVGGTISAAVGGKFANGARTAAFAHLFNAERARKRATSAESEVKAAYESGALGEGRQFATIDEAAKEVLGVLDPISRTHGVELGGFISASGDGYTYGFPIVGTQDNLPGLVNVPSGALAGFHTHPTGQRYFSHNDIRWVKGKNGTGIPLYLSGKGQVRACEVSSFSCSLTKGKFFPYDSNNPVYKVG